MKTDSMPVTSKVIVARDIWIAALKAAKSVAGKEPPYNVIQLRFDPARQEATLSAMNPQATLLVHLDAEILGIVEGRDELVEFAKVEIPALIHMPFAKPPTGEQIEAGIIIGVEAINITDESGFSLGVEVHDNRFPRITDESILGDARRAISRAREQARGKQDARIQPSHQQVDAIAKVHREFGGRAVLFEIAEDGDPSCIYASGSCWALITRAAKQNQAPPANDNGPKDTSEPNMADGIVGNVVSIFAESLADIAPKVQTANPPKGIA